MKFSRFECDEMTRRLHQGRFWADPGPVLDWSWAVVVWFHCFLSDTH